MHETTAPSSPASKSAARQLWFWAGWEPDRFYLRSGARKTPYFGNGDWVTPWRRTLESKSCLESLAEVGATVLITRFYKGFGPELERKDWHSLRAYVQRAHEAGLAVWGYVQGCSLFGEFLFNEREDAAGWIARNPKGEPMLWTGTYNRYAPCLTSPGYRAMVEEVVEEGLQAVNLDGIHMDNNYYRHCYCHRCKKLFRDWLTARGDLEELTGIPASGFIEPPPLSAESLLVTDPLALLWIEFGVQKRLEFMGAIQKKIQQTKPGASFSGNPGFLKSYPSRLTHGLDPVTEAEVCGTICVENGNQPRIEDGKLLTQADKHLFAEAGGLKPFITSWRPGEFGSSPPDTAVDIWAGLAEEFSFANAFLGNNWALRPAGDGGMLLLERLAEKWDVFTEAAGFFLSLDRRLTATPRRQWGEIALYVDHRAFSISPNSDTRIFKAFLLAAISCNVPLKIILRGQPIPEKTHTILIVQHRALEEAEFQRLRSSMEKKGGELWTIGDCGIFDEWAVARSVSLLKVWSILPHVRAIPISVEQWLEKQSDSVEYFKGEHQSLKETAHNELNQIFAALSVRQIVRIQSPDGLLTNVEESGKDGWFVHLRDLRPQSGGPATEIQLQWNTPRPPELRGYSPRWEEDGRVLSCRIEGGTLTLSIPSFDYYAGIHIRPV